MGKKPIKFVDLFAGIGGMRLALERFLMNYSRDSQCVLSCEIHKRAQETYKLNFGEVPISDIREVEALPDHDILLAGFPCQAFSYAGKQKGFADTRGTLFFEIERLLASAKKKPKFVILENVRGFTTHDKGRTFKTVLQKMHSLGYEVEPLLLNSSKFNVPQNRVRVYLVCKRGSKPNLSIRSDVGPSDSHKYKVLKKQIELFENQVTQSYVVNNILEMEVDKRFHCSDDFREKLKIALNGKPFESLNGIRLIDYRGGNSIHSWDLGLKGKCSLEERAFMNALIANRRKKHFGEQQDGKRLSIAQIKTFWRKPNLQKIISSLCKKGYLGEVDGTYNPVAGNMSFEVFKFLDPDSISITIVSSDASKLGVVQNGVPRRITPRECARLQGFPDTFKLHPIDVWAYHQMGNTVSVPVVESIFSNLASHDKEFSNMVQKVRAEARPAISR